MKKVIRNIDKYECLDDILCMAKLSSKYADKSITGEFGESIYFSKAQHSTSPRIKFYGGGKSYSSKDFPTLTFSIHGVGNIIGDKKNNPYLSDENYVNNVKSFVSRFLPLLLLTWYYKMDEADLQKYFEGTCSWKSLINSTNISELISCPNGDMEQLHEICLANNLYNFDK